MNYRPCRPSCSRRNAVAVGTSHNFVKFASLPGEQECPHSLRHAGCSLSLLSTIVHSCPLFHNEVFCQLRTRNLPQKRFIQSCVVACGCQRRIAGSNGFDGVQRNLLISEKAVAIPAPIKLMDWLVDSFIDYYLFVQCLQQTLGSLMVSDSSSVP